MGLGGSTAWRFDLIMEVKDGSLEEVIRLLRLKMRGSKPGWGGVGYGTV